MSVDYPFWRSDISEQATQNFGYFFKLRTRIAKMRGFVPGLAWLVGAKVRLFWDGRISGYRFHVVHVHFCKCR